MEMNKRVHAAATVALGVALWSSAQAEIYKCTVNGKTAYSERPCGADAETVQIKVAPVDQAAKEAAQQRISALGTRVQADQIRTKISSLESEINALNRKREADLQRIAAKKTRAANNLAGATWEQSLSTEMDATNRKYDSLISLKQGELERTREELARVEGQ